MPKAANAPQGRTAQLLCGAIAGPLFASAFTAIGATRAGYDWERLPVSSLAIGRHGWLQRMNFVVADALYSCAGARYQSKQPLPGSARAAALNSATTVGHSSARRRRAISGTRPVRLRRLSALADCVTPRAQLAA